MTDLDALLADQPIAAPSRHPWRGWEAAYLKKWYGIQPMPSIARTLGRSLGSVQSKARWMGLKGATNLGVFRIIPIEERFWQNVGVSADCWEWQGTKDSKGYGLITDRRKNIGAHRLSWQLCYGPIPDGLYVCHSCDNPSCVRPEHLFLGTNQDNQRDASAKGRSAFGDRNGARKRMWQNRDV